MPENQRTINSIVQQVGIDFTSKYIKKKELVLNFVIMGLDLGTGYND